MDGSVDFNTFIISNLSQNSSGRQPFSMRSRISLGHLISSKRGRRWISGHPLDCGVEDVHLLRLGIVFAPGPVCRGITLATGPPLIHPNLGRQIERRSLTPGSPFGALGGFKRRDLLTLPLIE